MLRAGHVHEEGVHVDERPHRLLQGAPPVARVARGRWPSCTRPASLGGRPGGPTSPHPERGHGIGRASPRSGPRPRPCRPARGRWRPLRPGRQRRLRPRGAPCTARRAQGARRRRSGGLRAASRRRRRPRSLRVRGRAEGRVRLRTSRDPEVGLTLPGSRVGSPSRSRVVHPGFPRVPGGPLPTTLRAREVPHHRQRRVKEDAAPERVMSHGAGRMSSPVARRSGHHGVLDARQGCCPRKSPAPC